MSHHLSTVVALAFATGVAAAPVSAWAAEKAAKSETAASTQKTQAGSSDFEENRKLHTQKSKENNEKKGAE